MHAIIYVTAIPIFDIHGNLTIKILPGEIKHLWGMCVQAWLYFIVNYETGSSAFLFCRSPVREFVLEDTVLPLLIVLHVLSCQTIAMTHYI